MNLYQIQRHCFVLRARLAWVTHNLILCTKPVEDRGIAAELGSSLSISRVTCFVMRVIVR